MKNQINKYSKTITQDESLPAAQAMLYAIGMSERDQQKAQVGIVSTGFQGNPCNMHLNDLATLVKKEVDVHISPEVYEGGLIGLVKDGDIITIDIAKNRIDVDIADQEIAVRRKEWKQPANTLLAGMLKKYRNMVSSASEGCVTTD